MVWLTGLVIPLLLGVIQCDLIGFNRLSNNVQNHMHHRNNQQRTNYSLQNFNFYPRVEFSKRYNSAQRRRPNTYLAMLAEALRLA